MLLVDYNSTKSSVHWMFTALCSVRAGGGAWIGSRLICSNNGDLNGYGIYIYTQNGCGTYTQNGCGIHNMI